MTFLMEKRKCNYFYMHETCLSDFGVLKLGYISYDIDLFIVSLVLVYELPSSVEYSVSERNGYLDISCLFNCTSLTSPHEMRHSKTKLGRHTAV